MRVDIRAKLTDLGPVAPRVDEGDTQGATLPSRKFVARVRQNLSPSTPPGTRDRAVHKLIRPVIYRCVIVTDKVRDNSRQKGDKPPDMPDLFYAFITLILFYMYIALDRGYFIDEITTQ